MRRVTIGAAQRPCVGESVCGDAFVVHEAGPLTTIAVVDGLGHGPLAGEAATAFCDHVLEEGDRSLEELMVGASQRLAGTRGAAAALLRVDSDAGTVEYVAVGNIECMSAGTTRVKPVSVPGIVGQRVRKVMTYFYELDGPSIIVLFSDGISARLDLDDFSRLDPQAMAEAILDSHGKTYDDATCVVVSC